MNRYGITVDMSKTEIDQIRQLRSEHIRQFPSIIMKNKDFAHLRNFILNHELNSTDIMRNAPDKIKVLNVMKSEPGFDYAVTCVNCYIIEYNSFNMRPVEFVKWLIDTFPRNFDWSLKLCKNRKVIEYIHEKTKWMSLPFANVNDTKYFFDFISEEKIQLKTRIYCILNDINEYPKCKTCGKFIISNVKSIYEGFRLHCDESCGTSDPDVQKKISATCIKTFGAKTYVESETGKTIRKSRMKELYGSEFYSQTADWKLKTEKTSISRYGTRWPTQNESIREKMSERNKELAPNYIKACETTRRKNRNGKFWTNEEIRRISAGNKTEANQAERLARAMKRRENYFYKKIYLNEWVEPLFSVGEFTSVPFSKLSNTEFLWKCKKCGKVFSSHFMLFYVDDKHTKKYQTYARCLDCYPNRRKSSLEEKQVKQFIESILPEHLVVIHGQYENFKIISPYQLDILIKDKTNGKIAFAVEFDGSKWHSVENGSNIDRQLRKTVMCEKLGIPLVHVFEDEWLYDRKNVENLLMSYVASEFWTVNFTEKQIEIDRSKYCKLVIPTGYSLVGEIPPNLITRRGLDLNCFGKNEYSVPDCGKLIYERIENDN